MGTIGMIALMSTQVEQFTAPTSQAVQPLLEAPDAIQLVMFAPFTSLLINS